MRTNQASPMREARIIRKANLKTHCPKNWQKTPTRSSISYTALNSYLSVLQRLLREEAYKDIDEETKEYCTCNPADLLAQKDFTTFDELHAITDAKESEGRCSNS